MLVAGLLAAQILPEADYSSMEIVAKAKEEVHTGIENLRYKKGEINSLPNGRLKECAAWTASDDTALRVTMEIRILCICADLWEAPITLRMEKYFHRGCL